MRILVLNQTFHPDVVATAQHLADLTAELAARGHEVTVITGRRAYATPEVEFPAEETWRGVQVERVWTPGLGKAAKWRRAVDFLAFLAGAALKLPFRRWPDVVLALTSPPLVSVIGAVASRWWEAHFVYWIMDLNPDEAVAAGWLKPGSLMTRTLEALSRWSLHSAARVVALDAPMKGRLMAKGVTRGRIELIPPWSHDGAVKFDAAGRAAFRQRHGWTEKFVVMYSGNHSPCHPLDTLLAAALELRGEERFLFAFVGGGTELKKVKAFRETHGLSSIVILPYQPLEELSCSLSAADVQVVVMGNPYVGIIHPCKIYNALEVGLPVLYLGPEPSHVTEALQRCGVRDSAVVAGHGETEKLVAGLREVAARPLMPRPLLDSPYRQNRLVAQWVRMLEGNLDRPGAGADEG